MEALEDIVSQAETALSNVTDLVALQQVRAQFLGKKGKLTELLKSLGKMPPEQRKIAGERINHAKQQVLQLA